ncbi:MAG: HDOD domain-containing protein [Blautia sp.]|nr:HDOD domain-containing protein [Blautia sp.]MCM1200507.1 HDOD domain-containing protein [Bacteroides fragilis]
MLATLIPLFDETMTVKAYSLFAQKENRLLNPSYLGPGISEGVRVAGFDLIESMGIETLSADKEIFVEVNNVSIFSNIDEQCQAPHGRMILLVDHTITPEEMYIRRFKELKEMGFYLAIRKLPIEKFEAYQEVLRLMDYILLDYKKLNIGNAKIFFNKYYPNIKMCAVNVDSQEDYDKLSRMGGFDLYEGKFFRLPVTASKQTEVAPLKVNYIELLNIVNDIDFDLSKAADVIGKDTALVISLLKMVNRMSVNSEITSIRHAAAMLGQKELKKWINTAVTNELCADRPSEITRLSLLRAKFAENLAPLFEMALHSSELFLMGLFSVLDLILDKPMKEALDMVKVSRNIEDALIGHKGDFAQVLDFILQYENASWQEVSRQMVLRKIDMDPVYDAYKASLQWYRDLFGAE